MDFFQVSCNINELFSLLDANSYELPKKKFNFKNDENVAKAGLQRTIGKTLKLN